MPVRLVIRMNAQPGKGGELLQVFKARCEDVMKEPGCEQFEIFQSALDPDRLTLLELWQDAAALAVHAEVNKTRAPLMERNPVLFWKSISFILAIIIVIILANK